MKDHRYPDSDIKRYNIPEIPEHDSLPIRIRRAVKQGLKQAYSNTSNPCITKIETELEKALLKEFR